ncbi:MAG TPA: isoprenylcysteine carboxylmethyltransferase family protein [Terriglobales bacterium]|nr:isoprenylcysteine carboxylmethyltransferase family protein [Terriglobales bacterium]
MTLDDIISNAFWVLWAVFFAYWIISALRIKRVKSAESLGSRLSYGLPIWTAYVLLLTDSHRWGPLSRHIYPVTLAVALTGLALTAFGIGFAIWARYTLGQNWSSKVTIKVDHELIRSGPYARVRHPIYTGILTALAGSALAMGEWRGWLAVLLALIAFCIKAAREEKMLAQEFGERFTAHQQQTGFLLPRM